MATYNPTPTITGTGSLTATPAHDIVINQAPGPTAGRLLYTPVPPPPRLTLSYVQPDGAGSLVPGTAYFWKVTTVNLANQESAGSNEVSLLMPSGVTRVTLSWTAVAAADSYNIYRSTVSGGESTGPNAFIGLTLSGTTTVVDNGIVPVNGVAPSSNNAYTATPIITWDFSPHGAIFTYVAGVNTYTPLDSNGNNYFYAAHGTPLTFTANVVWPSYELQATEYYWDFGDGTFAYGSSVTHSYKLPNQNCQAVLRVTDNYKRKWYCRKQMYIT